MQLTFTEIRPELRALLRIAWPLLISNFANVGITVADTVLAGRLGASALAAVAVGSSVWFTLLLLGAGVVMALGPTVAHHHGSGEWRRIGADTRQAFWLAVPLCIFVIILCRGAVPVLEWMQIEPHVVILADGFIYALCWGAPGVFLFAVLRQMSEGVGRTVPIMVIMLTSLPVNVALNVVFIYGHFGAPALGAVGCGVGSALTYWLMFLALAIYTWRAPFYRQFQLWDRIDGLHPETLRRLWVIGFPIGIALLMEVGLFGALTLVLGRFGSETVAAHQIAMNYSSMVFMGPLAFAMATTVRVGQALGRGSPAEARRAAAIGVGLCQVFMWVCVLITLVARHAIVGLYTADAGVASIAAGLMIYAAIMQPGDGGQVALMGALRGFRDTRVPMLLNIVVFWGVGFSIAWTLGVRLGYGATGVWTGIIICIWLEALVLFLRFRWLTRG